MAELAQSLGLDLPDAFPGHVEFLSQLFQGAGLPVLQPEAQGQHPFLCLLYTSDAADEL